MKKIILISLILSLSFTSAVSAHYDPIGELDDTQSKLDGQSRHDDSIIFPSLPSNVQKLSFLKITPKSNSENPGHNPYCVDIGNGISRCEQGPTGYPPNWSK